jgi:RNA polymerase sigma factor (sigma-70 family)
MATIAPEVPVLARDEAFEKLYRRYVKDVYHYALALLRNPADAEDVTQTTFLNAYRAFQRGEEIRKPQNWLIKIAHNVARSRYAYISRRVKEVPLEDHVEQLAIAEEEKPNVEAVLRALGRLPFNQRAALVMRELEGRSYAEISDTLGVSVAAVETLIFRARRSLRVRTAALRSILTVPVPGSLGQLFGGGGGAAAGGIGASMLIKTAVALVVGGVATGLGVERATHATAAPRPAASAPASRHVVENAAAPTVRAVKPHGAAAARATEGAVGKRLAGQGMASRPSSHSSASQPAAASGPAPASSASASASSSAPAAAPAEGAAATVTQTAQNVVETADQAVDSVVAALPVSVPPVPPLPVEPPPLPKLP